MSFESMMNAWDAHAIEQPRPSAYKIKADATMLCEVGVHKGWNAKVLLEMRPSAKIVLIDDLNPTYPTLKVLENPLTPNQRDQWIFRLGVELSPVYNRIKYYFEDSLTAVKRFEDNTFDYVYLDNTRDVEQIAEQMRQWFTKVKPGGVLAGSGINCNCHEDMIKALNKVFGGKFESFTPDWWVIK